MSDEVSGYELLMAHLAKGSLESGVKAAKLVGKSGGDIIVVPLLVEQAEALVKVLNETMGE